MCGREYFTLFRVPTRVPQADVTTTALLKKLTQHSTDIHSPKAFKIYSGDVYFFTLNFVSPNSLFSSNTDNKNILLVTPNSFFFSYIDDKNILIVTIIKSAALASLFCGYSK